MEGIGPCVRALPQLFLDVFTKTEPKTCSTRVLLHSGHFTFFSPCSEIFSIRWNVCPHFLQR